MKTKRKGEVNYFQLNYTYKSRYDFIELNSEKWFRNNSVSLKYHVWHKSLNKNYEYCRRNQTYVSIDGRTSYRLNRIHYIEPT